MVLMKELHPEAIERDDKLLGLDSCPAAASWCDRAMLESS